VPRIACVAGGEPSPFRNASTWPRLPNRRGLFLCRNPHKPNRKTGGLPLNSLRDFSACYRFCYRLVRFQPPPHRSALTATPSNPIRNQLQRAPRQPIVVRLRAPAVNQHFSGIRHLHHVTYGDRSLIPTRPLPRGSTPPRLLCEDKRPRSGTEGLVRSIYREDLDNRALRLLRRFTFANSVSEYALHRLQIGDLSANVCDVSGGDAPDCSTGRLSIGCCQTQQAANLIQRKAQLARPTDETQPGNIIAIITPKPSPLATRPRQQSDPLVITDCLDIALGSPR
jgi:hypothetical protein